MRRTAKRRRLAPAMGLTTMVDIALLLLVYWVAASSAAGPEIATAVQLPLYRPAPVELAATDPDVLVIDLAKTGEWSIGGKHVGRSGLRDAIDGEYQEHGAAAQVILRCDKAASFENVHDILVMATTAGITSFDIRGQPAPASGE